jgi:ribosome-associated protein
VSASADLRLPPGRGIPNGLTIPATELVERFSRSSGPGGQGVNTTDSRVELSFDVRSSAAFTEQQRTRALDRLAGRLVDGVLKIASSEQRSQLQNRMAARARLVHHLSQALAPAPPARRASTPSRAARQRRLDVKRQRGQVKAGRGRVREE